MEIHIEITLAADGMPTDDELEVRNDIEVWLVENDIGEVVDVGAGGGRMDIFVEVDDDARDSVARIRQFLENEGISSRASVRQVVPDTVLYDEDV